MSEKGLCQCGCGTPTLPAPRTHSRIGWKKGEPRPYFGNHGYRREQMPKHEVDPDTGCWNWMGHVCKSTGYGMSYDRDLRKPTTAHRWMWQRERGPVPDGLELDHLCRNRRCVNPDHLEPVTRSENVLRGFASRREAIGATHA